MNDLNQVLANCAVTGLFQGQVKEAFHILEFLEQESVDQESLACLRGLALFSQGDFNGAISCVSEWTQDKPPSFAHSLLALFYWQSGQSTQAEHYCQQVLDHSEETKARQLVTDLLPQLRSH